ncbi:MAG: DNA-directed RNA polymerase subunit omega [Candidatus Omnitrophota bacterium]
MAYQPLEKLLPQAKGSIYKLILLASQRALELAEGAPRLVEYPSSDKPATVALDEICEAKISLDAAKNKEPTKD